MSAKDENGHNKIINTILALSDLHFLFAGYRLGLHHTIISRLREMRSLPNSSVKGYLICTLIARPYAKVIHGCDDIIIQNRTKGTDLLSTL
jgi:hypothetical protein